MGRTGRASITPSRLGSGTKKVVWPDSNESFKYRRNVKREYT